MAAGANNSVMAKLNISKVAVGCASIEALERRQRSRLVNGIVPVLTRFRPRRADELVGGSIYWIVKHRIAARQTILGFADREEDRRTIIRLDPHLVAVRAVPRRAHQGWRYLVEGDAPRDLGRADDALVLLPTDLCARLAGLALI